jgi:hypothetical protein
MLYSGNLPAALKISSSAVVYLNARRSKPPHGSSTEKQVGQNRQLDDAERGNLNAEDQPALLLAENQLGILYKDGGKRASARRSRSRHVVPKSC